MRNLSRALVLGALAVAAAGAHAQIGRPDAAQRFAEADANHDGQVSLAEFQAARAARFAKADRNGDGVLTDDDLPRFARSNPAMLAKIHAMQHGADRDGDGRITREEFDEAGNHLFALADANHDGVVDAAEMRQVAQRMQSLAAQRSAP